MWMFPAEAGVARADVMRQHANEPTRFDNPPPELASEKARAWQERWTRVVLR